MSNLFKDFNNDPRMEKQKLLARVSAARTNLLFVVIFTLFNILLLTTNSGTYFLFSAAIPYYLVDIGMFFCGRYPLEVYTGEFEGMLFADQSVFWVLLVIAIILVGVYLLLWFLSRKGSMKPIVCALVFFSFDTMVMLLNGGLSAAFDLIFHIWIIVILAMGISSHKKLIAMPQGNAIEAEFTDVTDQGEVADSPILRPADTTVKSRVIIQGDAYNYHIIYRRVKKTNELVINGNVYAEYVATIEMPHELHAKIDGHNILVGCDATSHSFITVDGDTVARKIRWI